MKSMKHMKTFESFSLNEENKFKKFFTGHGSKDDKAKKMADFQVELDKYEKMAKDDTNVVFDKESCEKKAKANNYKGKLEKRKSAKDDKFYVIYVKGNTGLEEIGSLAANKRDTPLN